MAIEKTSGDYIAFLDTDDWWVEDYLSNRIKIFNEKEDHIFSFSNCYHYFQRKKKKKKFLQKPLFLLETFSTFYLKNI